MIHLCEKPLNIAFCVNDTYVPYICVTIKSILENNRGAIFCFHILTDAISDGMKERLIEVINGNPHSRLEIIQVDDSKLAGLPTKSWSRIAWYRIILPEVLSTEIDRVLYLDADTLVKGAIRGLFEMDLDGISVAGVVDPEAFNEQTYSRCGYIPESLYICSGVLMINLSYWRANDISNSICEYAMRHKEQIKFPDQDSINVICEGSKAILPLYYGVQGAFFRNEVFYSKSYLEELESCIESPVIIHYAGQAPWKKEWANHLFQKDWERYNAMLKHPAKRYYLTKGYAFVKMMLWRGTHPFRIKSRSISKNEILNRIKEVRTHDS